MHIGILGGSFDPPHRGHVLIFKRLLKLLKLDQIILMPCFQHPFNKTLSPAKIRFEMTKFLENDLIKTSDFELRNKTISYTIDTLNFLSEENPKNIYYWIIGTDQVNDFTKWKNWRKIIDKFGLVVVPRKSTIEFKTTLNKIIKQSKHQNNIILIDRKSFSPINISSSKIRKDIKANKSISRLLPKKVEKYIIRNKLYL